MMPANLDLETTTLRQLTGLLAEGGISNAGLLNACLERIEAVDRRGPALRSVRALDPASFDTAARRRPAEPGPLEGIPVLIKDNVDVAGLPTTAGALALADSHPPGDAWLVGRLLQAGAVIAGKANLTEMANFLTDGMPSGYSSLGGQVLNPYDTAITPGGSSSGSAVAVAVGLVPLAVGTETNGSILSPAESCSVVGIKPTVGLVSRSGIVPIAHTQDTAGPLAVDVHGAAALLGAMAGADPEDPATEAAPAAYDYTQHCETGALRGARIGVADIVPSLGAEVAWLAARDTFARCGATLVPVHVDRSSPGLFVLTFEFGADLDAYFARLGPKAPIRSVAELVAFNEAHATEALKFGQRRLAAASAVDHGDTGTIASYHQARAADLAYSRGQVDRLLVEEQLHAILFPGPASADLGARAGYPSIALPAGYTTDARRPFGVTLLGPAWSEPTLIGYAYDYEQAAQARRPPSQVNPARLPLATPGATRTLAEHRDRPSQVGSR
jgi:amidase